MKTAIPTSLLRDISRDLINIVLGDVKTDKVPADTARKIIYLWRQDSLATIEGIQVLSSAASLVDPEALSGLVRTYGIESIVVPV